MTTSDIITVWHGCTAERHRQCIQGKAHVEANPPVPTTGTIVWELHPPQSTITDSQIDWTEAMRWPHQISAG